MEWFFLIIIVIVVVFMILQIHSNRTYKPTKEEIKEILNKTIEGELELFDFDEFSSVKIHYNKELEEIRLKYVKILANVDYNSINDNENPVPLNDNGKIEIQKLIGELN